MSHRNQSVGWMLKSRERLSCHRTDWVHKACVLIRACSSLRAAIMQQTGLFSMRLLLLLLVATLVVIAAMGRLGRRELFF